MKRQYEAMFLFDPSFAGDFSNAETEIRRLMDRAEAQIVFCRRWDERKLAYEIRGRKRGVYGLVYFQCDPERIRGIERDAQLSEPILRLLVLRADEVTPEAMETMAPPERRQPPPAGEEPGAPVEAGATVKEPEIDDESEKDSAAVGAGPEGEQDGNEDLKT